MALRVIKQPQAAYCLWRLGRNRLIMMMVGFVLYACISYVTRRLEMTQKAYIMPFDEPLLFDFSIDVIVSCLVRLTFLFCVVLYGPWVGIVFPIGMLIGGYLAAPEHALSWHWWLGESLMGLTSGLILYKTQGYYNTSYAIILTTEFVALAQTVGLIFPLYVEMLIWHRTLFVAMQSFLVESVSAIIVTFTLLPILLILHNKWMEQIIDARNR